MVAMFLSGMTAGLFITASIFFLKFWRASKNRFFGLFALACGLMAMERIVALCFFTGMPPGSFELSDVRGAVYSLRLLAFVAIFAAVIDRNRSMRAQRKALREGPDAGRYEGRG